MLPAERSNFHRREACQLGWQVVSLVSLVNVGRFCCPAGMGHSWSFRASPVPEEGVKYARQPADVERVL
jgi:hypothetical protein